MQTAVWKKDPLGAGLHTETEDTASGVKLRVWAENVPAVPDEPYGPPFADLATQMMLVPMRLLESWESVCKFFDEVYQAAQKKDGEAVKKARAIADRAGGGARPRAEAIYRFVRDEIANAEVESVAPREGSTVGKTLADQKGSSADKALLLQAMLAAAQVKSRLVWAADRSRGQVDMQVANPAWFDRVLIMAELDGGRVFLDPSDRALGFGQIRHGYEGMPAVLYDRETPETITLPESPFDQNGRRAVIDLTLDETGALAGTGELVLTGAHAWERIDWQDDDARTLEAWKKWLADRFQGFAVSDVSFEERPDDRTVQLTWKLAHHEEDVLGDETSLVPSRPLGPGRQPFLQPAGQRRSPVLLPHAGWEEMELRLRWPAGWRVDALPGLVKQDRAVGALVVDVVEKEAERTLVYRRRIELRRRRLDGARDYDAVRGLFAAVEKSDAQILALVRR
jgi:hypothetical protein